MRIVFMIVFLLIPFTAMANRIDVSGGGSSGSSYTSTDAHNDTGWTKSSTKIFPTVLTDNIGIGSDNPGQKLDIVGTIRLNGHSTISDDGAVLHIIDPTDSIEIVGDQDVTISSLNLDFEGTAGTLINDFTNVTLNAGTKVEVDGPLLDIESTKTYFNGNVGIGSLNPGKVLDVNGTIRATGFMTPTGISSQFLKANGTVDASTYSTATGANPSASVSTSAVNGSASTFMRSDGAPALSQSISPTWTGNHIFAPTSGNTTFTKGNVGIGTATASFPLDVFRTTGLSNGMPIEFSIGGNVNGSQQEGAFRVDATSTGAFGGNGQILALNGYNNANFYMALTNWSGASKASPGSAVGYLLFTPRNYGLGELQSRLGNTSTVGGGGLGHFLAGSLVSAEASLITGDGTIEDDGSGNITGTGTYFTHQVQIGDLITDDNTVESAKVIGIGGNSGITLSTTIDATAGDTYTIQKPFISVSDGSTNYFTVTPQGLVGIQEPNPTDPLTINATSGNGAYGSAINFNLDHVFKGNFGVSGGNSYILSGDTAGDYVFRAEQKMLIGSGGDHIRMTLQSDGNVGIGTTLPATLFEVGTRKFNILSGGNVGVGTINPKALLSIGGNVLLDRTTSAIIMKEPDGTCGSCTLSNTEVFTCASLTCP